MDRLWTTVSSGTDSGERRRADDGSRRPGPSDLDGMTGGRSSGCAARQVGKSPRDAKMQLDIATVKEWTLLARIAQIGPLSHAAYSS